MLNLRLTLESAGLSKRKELSNDLIITQPTELSHSICVKPNTVRLQNIQVANCNIRHL